MPDDSFNELTQSVARDLDAVVLEGIPVGGPWMRWPNDDAQAFVASFAPLKPQVVYVDTIHSSVAVVVGGVIHYFGGDVIIGDLELEDVFELNDNAWNVRLRSNIPEDIGDIAETIAQDPRFDPLDQMAVDQLIEETGIQTDSPNFETARSQAILLFYDGPEKALQREARKLARRFLEHPEFDPLLLTWDGVDQDDLYLEVIGTQEPRLERRVASAVLQAVGQKGLREKAESEFKKAIMDLMSSVPRSTLDQIGFSTRNAAREEILAPYLASVPKQRWPLAAYWVKKFEEEGRSIREIRYAFAASLLIYRGESKSAVARMLHLSPSAMERILRRSIPVDFRLDPEDPILLELAPELRAQPGIS